MYHSVYSGLEHPGARAEVGCDGSWLLAIDVGNTQTALGLFDGETARRARRLATDGIRTATA